MCRANETYYVDGFSYYSSKTDTNLIRVKVFEKTIRTSQ